MRGETDLATTHPDVARQLADPSLAVNLMAGSAKEQEVRGAFCSHRTVNGGIYRLVCVLCP